MDRHDVPGATAQDVADAHVSDLKVATKHNVNFFSYWYDSDDGAVFCFAEAPSPEHMTATHQESHGLIPNEIIEVSEDNVLRFLGKVRDPADYTEVTSPFRVIMFTDLEGSTTLLESLGESEFMVLLTEHDLMIRRALVSWRGREVKHTGDGFLLSFDDLEKSLHCALAINEAFEKRMADGAKPALQVRIGIDAGEPVDRNDDIFGRAVTGANRICEVAMPGHPLVSERVHTLGEQRGFSFGKGEVTVLKGFSKPAPLFELLDPPG